jgi:hypothetical protein
MVRLALSSADNAHVKIRPEGEPRWAWQLLSASATLLVVASAVTVVTGVVVLILLAFG